MVVDAAKAVEVATASGDAQQIHAAAKALEAIVRGEVPVAAPAAPVVAADPEAQKTDVLESNEPAAQEERPQAATETIAEPAPGESEAVAEEAPAAEAEPAEASEPAEAAAPAEPPPAPKPAAKPVVAMRGDDRPGMRKAEAAPAGRGGKFGDRKDARSGPGGKPGGKPSGPRQSTDNKFEPYRPEREDRGPRDDRGAFSDRRDSGARSDDRGARPTFEDRGPRLGDAAFRAQREAFEAANLALKKLHVQAHGEVLTNVISAWEKRDAALLPSAQDLGKVITPAVLGTWAKAVTTPSGKDAAESLLRLEMAAEVPTPAEHISARRMMQLQLLTKRNAPAPADTWGEDTAKVLAADFDAANARRVQTVLKVLLKR